MVGLERSSDGETEQLRTTLENREAKVTLCKKHSVVRYTRITNKPVLDLKSEICMQIKKIRSCIALRILSIKTSKKREKVCIFVFHEDNHDRKFA